MCLPPTVKGAFIQRIASIIGNLLCFNFAMMFGITPVHVQLYQSEQNTPLRRAVDASSSSWVAGYLFLSAAGGALILGMVARRIGSKNALLLGGLLQVTSWFCIHFGYHILHIYSSRIFAGMAGGAALVVLPAYIREIAEEANYDALLAYIDQSRAIGVLAGFLMAQYLPYELVNIVGIGFSLIFLLLFPFVQESPYFYMRTGNMSSLEKSLRWYRGIRHIDDRDNPEYQRELKQFQSNMERRQISEPPLSRGYCLKLGFLCCILTVGAQLSGVFVILYKCSDLLTNEHAVLTPNITALLLGLLQLFGAFTSGWIRTKFSRRVLLTVTSFICGFALLTYAAFITYGAQWHITPLYAPWLPLSLLSLHMVLANIGPYPLATVISAEILPSKLYTCMVSVMMALGWLSVFLFIQFYQLFIELVELALCFWIFAAACITLAFTALFLLPETYGKSLEEVQQKMGYVCDGNVAKMTTEVTGTITQGHI